MSRSGRGLASTRTSGQNAWMDQEREDYADNDLPPPSWQSNVVVSLTNLFAVAAIARGLAFLLRVLTSSS